MPTEPSKLASKAKEKMKSGSKVRSIRVEPASNGGFMCHVDYQPEEKKKGKDGECCGLSWQPETPLVYADKAALLKGVGELL